MGRQNKTTPRLFLLCMSECSFMEHSYTNKALQGEELKPSLFLKVKRGILKLFSGGEEEIVQLEGRKISE